MSTEHTPRLAHITDDLREALVESISSFTAFVGLQEGDAAVLRREVGSVITDECTRLCRVHGAATCVGPAGVSPETSAASAQSMLIGWLSPALNAEGRSFGCALTVGSQRVHIAVVGASPAMLYGVVVLPTYAFVAHGTTLVVEAQRPVCILSFSQLCQKAISLAPLVQSSAAPSPTRVHACGKVVSVGAPFRLRRDGSPAMLVVLLLNASCALCRVGDGDTAVATDSVTLLIKGADLVPQWRDLIEPGLELHLTGLEKQRIPAEGEGGRNATVLRVKQHPTAAVCSWTKARDTSAAGGAFSALGTIACHRGDPELPSTIERPPRPGSVEQRHLDAWIGACATRIAGDQGSFFRLCVERQPGSSVSFSGIVTYLSAAVIVFDNDLRTALWWVPTLGGLTRRPSLPAALRLGCRATVDNAHPLLVGRRLIGLGWCAATSVVIADVSGGWLGLGDCEIGGRRAARADAIESADAESAALAPLSRLSTHLTPTSIPAIVWLQACLRRLVVAGLAVPVASSTQGARSLEGSSGAETILDAWRMLQTAARAVLWPWQDALTAAVPAGEERFGPVPSGRLLGPLSYELMSRSCDRAVLWNGETPVGGDVDDAIPMTTCAAAQGFPASRALLIYTPTLVGALGQCAAAAITGAFKHRTDASFALYKDCNAVRARDRAWASAMCRAILLSAPVAGFIADTTRYCGASAASVQVLPGADWASIRIRMSSGGCRRGITPLFVAVLSPVRPDAMAAHPVSSSICTLRDASVDMCALSVTEHLTPSSLLLRENPDRPPEEALRQEHQLALLKDFVFHVDVVRCQLPGIDVRPFDSSPDALLPFLHGGILAADSIATTTAGVDPTAAGLQPTGQVPLHSWRLFAAPKSTRKRRKQSTPGKIQEAVELDLRRSFAVRMFLQYGGESVVPVAGRRGPMSGAPRATGQQTPLVCSVRSSLTGLGDSLAVLVKKARVCPILIGTVEHVAIDTTGLRGAPRKPKVAEESAGVTNDAPATEGVGCSTLKLRLRHVPLVPRVSERRLLGCSFGPESVDVFCPCSFVNDASSSLPLGFGPGAIIAIERVRPVVAPKSRNIYWVALDASAAKPVITVLAGVNAVGPAGMAASEVLRRLAVSYVATHDRPAPPPVSCEPSVDAAPADSPALLLLDRLLWPLGGAGSSKIGTASPSQRTCRSLALDPSFDRTHLVLRGQPRQVLWASVQWEDCATGGALEPCDGDVRGLAATLARKRVLQSCDPPAGLTVLGVPMQHRRAAGTPSPTSPPLCEPIFKLEAKIIVDDGTGEAVVHVCDAYLLEDIERCAAELERRAAGSAVSLPVRAQGAAASVPILQLGVAASVLGTSAFWLCHWASAAAFFGQIQVLPRLSAAAGAAVPPPAGHPVDAGAGSLTAPAPAPADPATARFAPLLAIEQTVPSGLFGHLCEERPVGFASSASRQPPPVARSSASARTPAGITPSEPVGSKRKARRRSTFASATSPAMPATLPALLAAHFTSRLPHASIEAAAASLHTHLARGLCTSPVAAFRDGAPGRGSTSHAALHGTIVALDLVCIRIFPGSFVSGSASAGGAETAAAHDASELDRRSLATRKLAEGSLRRLLGLSDGAPTGQAAVQGVVPPRQARAPALRNFDVACAPPANIKVTLRCLDVRPVGTRSFVDAASNRCSTLLAALAASDSDGVPSVPVTQTS